MLTFFAGNQVLEPRDKLKSKVSLLSKLCIMAVASLSTFHHPLTAG